MAKIGFIGLGNMGLPMAQNLFKAGHSVCGFDVAKAQGLAVEERGFTLEEAYAGREAFETSATQIEHARDLLVIAQLTKRIGEAVKRGQRITSDVACDPELPPELITSGMNSASTAAFSISP